MKRIIALCLALSMVLGLSVTSFAVDGATMNVTGITDGSIEVGDEITVTLTVPPVTDVSGFSIGFYFDTDVLEAVELNLPEKVAGKNTVYSEVSDANDAGYVAIVVAEADNFNVTENIVMIAKFTVKSDAVLGECENLVYISEDDYYFENADGDSVEAPVFDKESVDVTIVKPATAITLSTTALAMNVDDVVTLTANVTPADTTDKIVWSVSGNAVSIDEDGKVTAIKEGTATVTATAGNVSASCEVTVSKKLPTYTIPNNLTATYGDLLSSVVMPDGWSWEAGADETVGNKGTNAFKATFTPVDTDTYATVTGIDVSVEVAPKNISGVTIANINDQEYTGSQIKPEPAVADGSVPLVEGADFEYSYDNNIEKGTATVTVTGMGNYTGTASKNFEIVAAAGSVTISGDLSKTYDGEAVTTTAITVNKTGTGAVTFVFLNSDDEEIDAPTDAGSYKVYAKLAATDNYGAAESAKLTFTIAKADFTPTVSIEGWTYGEDAKSPAAGNNTSGGAVTYEYKAQGSDVFSTTVPTNAGTHTVKATIAATANYNSASATAQFVIAKASITPAVTLEDWTYGGIAEAPSVTGNTGNGTVTYEYKVKGADDSTYTTTVPTNAGTYWVRATVAETTNYKSAASTDEFVINKAEQTITGDGFSVKVGKIVTPNFQAEGALSYEIVAGDTTGSAIVDGQVKAGTTTGSFTLKVTAAATDNYNATTKNVTVTVTAKDTQVIEASNVTATYGDTDKKVEAKLTVGDGSISYAVTAGADVVEVNASTGALTIKKVGTATVTVTAAENTDYAEQTKAVTVTVNPKAVTAPAVDTTAYTYNGTEQTYKIAENAAYTVAGNKQTNAGSYEVTVALKDTTNYKWNDNTTADKTFTFEIKKATITVTAKNIAIKVKDTVPAPTYTITGLAAGETLEGVVAAIDGEVDNSKEGEYTIKVTGPETLSDNYNQILYVNGKLTISKKSDNISPVGPKPQQPETPDKPVETTVFNDIAGQWFEADVKYVAEKGLMTGVGGDKFAPNMNTSRGMIVTILWRMEGQPVPKAAAAFTDVEEAAYYELAVAWANENGIVTGYGATFGPNDNITREQFAVILFRYAQYKGMDAITLAENLIGYADHESVSPYAVQAMNWAVGQGLINGSDGKLMPAGSATRAQTAAILHRFCENIK